MSKASTLSAITEGLPGELPSNGREFSGKVRIPTALLEDAKNISLTLTDYQKLQLRSNLCEVKTQIAVFISRAIVISSNLILTVNFSHGRP